jgi:phosphate starvation-inducible membrane PsiE
MNNLKKYIPLALTLSPFFALATTFQNIISTATQIVTALVPLLIAVGVVVFIIGVVKYISAGADAGKRTEGRNMMIYGVIGLFVMLGFWGLVNLLASTLNLDTATVPQAPGMP